jgi:chromosomal replication initiation ATPase DnaA
MHTVEQRNGIWRLSLEQIEATVADHLGNGRVSGNQATACLSRQVSMYLAKNVGGWSTTKIGRFYNGRHHTTVLHAIEKIERLRQTDESLDALIEVITAELSPGTEGSFTERHCAERVVKVAIEQIEATVADHLGNGRVRGNQSAPCLSRQVSMYLAKNVVGWSTTKIGRFYNGRHHTTVLHAIEKIERLRETDESLDALIEVITAKLCPGTEGCFTERFSLGGPQR